MARQTNQSRNTRYKQPQGKKPQKQGFTLSPAQKQSLNNAKDTGLDMLGKAGRLALEYLGKGARALFELIRSSRVALAITAVLALVLLGSLFDFATNFNKAYSGVSVGGVDVSGLNEQEIENKVAQEYAKRLNSAGVTIYANNQAFNDRTVGYNDTYYDDTSLDETEDGETPSNKSAWSTDAASLQAYIDYSALAQDALSQGRSGPLDRLSMVFNKVDLEIPVKFNDAIVESLAQEIDHSIGEPLENYGVEVVDGSALVTSGHDGDMVNRDTLKDKIAALLVSPESDNRSFVVETEYTPVAISRDEAQQTADLINEAIGQGISFSCGNDSWFADAAELGSWIQTPIAKREDGSSYLAPSFALQKARTSVLTHIQPSYESGSGHVRFTQDNGAIQVHATSKGTFPLVGDALEKINIEFFSNVKSEGNPSRTVELGTSDIPEYMTLDEALSFGIITPISTFETEYTEGAYERNTNIHLVADLINNSIVSADGGKWSFNDTAGECNAEKGFLEAGALTGGSLVDEIGGGICQVATTVFNAVYEAGYPVVERHNHSVYFPNYPEGRDAAISWPEPDFVWQNDSPSDILLVMSYTDSTVAATLYGEDMGYRVESEEGEIIEGVKSTTTYVDDDELYAGVTYTRTPGSDGHSVTVTRKVYDTDGELLITDYFTSVYKPQNTIIVRGTRTL